jgi:large subunit ribosomal protein L25
MKLSVFPRTLGKKSEINRIRREGGVPAVLYGRDQSMKSFFLKGVELQAILRKLKSGLLATIFFELHEGTHVLKAITGLAECAGVKLGGFMRQVIRSLKVSCLPCDMPTELFLDVTALGLGQSMRLSDLAIPSGVRPLAKMNEVAVVIAKKV